MILFYSKASLNNESVMQQLLLKGMSTGEDLSKFSFLYTVFVEFSQNTCHRKLVWPCNTFSVCRHNFKFHFLWQHIKRDNSVTIRERNIQSLAIELFKTKNGYTLAFMNKIFTLKRKVLYCSEQIFMTRNVRTVHNGTETLSYLGPKIWLIIPIDIKDSMSLGEFKRKIRLWKPTNCPCRICKVYINNVGFIGAIG